jgi:hypothetical protein
MALMLLLRNIQNRIEWETTHRMELEFDMISKGDSLGCYRTTKQKHGSTGARTWPTRISRLRMRGCALPGGRSDAIGGDEDLSDTLESKLKDLSLATIQVAPEKG